MATPNTEKWSRVLQEQLFNATLAPLTQTASNFSEEGKDAIKIYLTNAGNLGNVIKTDSVKHTQRTAIEMVNTVTTLALEQFETPVYQIEQYEALWSAVNKRNQIINQQSSALSARLYAEAITKWAPATLTDGTNAIYSSGASVGTVYNVPPMTGNKKGFTLEDIHKIKSLMDRQGLPTNDRYVVLPVDVYNQVLTLAAISDASAFGRNSGGVLPNVTDSFTFRGLTIVSMPFVALYNLVETVMTFKAFTAAGQPDYAAGTFQAGLAFQKDAIGYAYSNMRTFVNSGVADRGGSDIISSVVNFGAVRTRTDNKGVITILMNAA